MAALSHFEKKNGEGGSLMRSLAKGTALTALPVAGILLALWLFTSPECMEAGDDLISEAISSEIPTDADFEEKSDQEQNREFFDHFAWREFIALSWPADETERGKPHATKKFGDPSTPTVWMSWKSVEDFFPPDLAKAPLRGTARTLSPWYRTRARMVKLKITT
jgi:hypothetical protein